MKTPRLVAALVLLVASIAFPPGTLAQEETVAATATVPRFPIQASSIELTGPVRGAEYVGVTGPRSAWLGVESGGARRWLGVGELSFQPSEMMKITLILALARYYQWLPPEKIWRPDALIPPLLLIGVPVLLALAQPDLGTAILFVPALFVVLLMGGARVRHVQRQPPVSRCDLRVRHERRAVQEAAVRRDVARLELLDNLYRKLIELDFRALHISVNKHVSQGPDIGFLFFV